MASEATADRQTGSNNGTTSHTVTLPTNLAAGDIIHIAMSFDDQNAGGVTVPSGYDLKVDLVPHVVITREADGTEGASMTVTTGSSVDSGFVSRRILDGDYAGIEAAAEPSDGSDTNNANPDPPSLAPAGDSADYLWIASFGCRVSRRILNSYPTDYGDGDTGSTGNTRAASATRALTASSEDPGNFEMSSNAPWVAVTTAIPPGGLEPGTISEGAFGDDQQQDIDVGSVDSEADHHDLERSPAGAGTWSVVLDDQTLSGGETLTDATVEPDTQYDYRLVSYELADESDGGTPSNTVTVETAPARPRLLRLGFNRCKEARMDTERAAGDGVAVGFEKLDSTDLGATYSIDAAEGAQQIEVTDQDGGSEASVFYGAGSVNPGEEWTVEVGARFPSLDLEINGKLFFVFKDADGNTGPIDGVKEQETNHRNTSWERKTIQATAPDGATTLDVRLGLATDSAAGSDSGTALIRDLQIVGPDQQTVDSFKVTGLDEADDVGKVNWFLRDVDAGEDFAPIAELVNATGDQNVEHEVKNLEPATYEITATASEGDRESGWAEPLTNVLGGQTITETLIDSLAFSENLNRDFEGDRSITDDLPSGENFGASLTVGREANRDNLAFAENFQENAVFGRQISDDLSLTEQLVIDRTLTRLIEDSLGFSENLTRTVTDGQSLTRTIQDTINFAENLIRDTELDRLMNDNLTFTENLNVLVNDSPISQAVERHWRFQRFQNLRRERRWSDESDMWDS